MKDLNDNIESPFTIKVSFNKLLDYYENLEKSDDEFISAKARRVLIKQRPHPILRSGFSDVSFFSKYEKEIKLILQDSFSEILTKNEIIGNFLNFFLCSIKIYNNILFLNHFSI